MRVKQLIPPLPLRGRSEESSLVFEIAKTIFDRQRKLGISQTDLANLSGIKQPQISRIMSAATVPTLTTIERLAQALGCRVVVTLEPLEEKK